MHCPRCGQQQISDQTKFCSQCGFQLGLVAELLVHGGFLPQLAELNNKSTLFTRKNGLVFSLFWFIIWVPLLTSIFGGVLNIEELGVLCALIGVFGAFMIFIASLVYLKPAPKRYYPASDINAANAAGLYSPANQNALPPQQSQPVSTYMPPEGAWRAADTGDFARPGSVTDNTTKLLKKDQDQ
ncbi:MAG: hypothetical protein WKF92_06275 [Pyrinomonadaceae bacterium]